MELDRTAEEPQAELTRNDILRSEPSNPALQRLKARVLAGAEASEVISSYDRMHHRHSRS